MEQRGFILIADITGYTAYLNESELEHAQGTLTALLELLIDHTRSPLVISRLEGDAVISYGLESGFVGGQTFLETIENTYFDFRKAIELMVLNNTCKCNACANISALDLKFFVHFGSFVLQSLGAHDELLGTDVNLIHRLLKNTVTAATGIRAYLLCTDAALRALGLEDPGDTMVPHTEVVADLGEVAVWITDMQPAYEARAAIDRITFDDDEVLGTMEADTVLAQHVVWDYLADPRFRKLLMGSDRQEVTDRKGGRIAAGSAFQCYHGDTVVPQVVLEWDPFERMVIEQAMHLPGGQTSMVMDYALTPLPEGGTRISCTVARLAGSGIRRAVWGAMVRMMGIRARRQLAGFRDGIEADYEQRAPAVAASRLDLDTIARTAHAGVARWNLDRQQEPTDR